MVSRLRAFSTNAIPSANLHTIIIESLELTIGADPKDGTEAEAVLTERQERGTYAHVRWSSFLCCNVEEYKTLYIC